TRFCTAPTSIDFASVRNIAFPLSRPRQACADRVGRRNREAGVHRRPTTIHDGKALAATGGSDAPASPLEGPSDQHP
ncbi:MAG TPA: hypothetical protein VKQ09_07905, partial [Sphingomonas sp.]|nr:hypothetical protein [Sphingomonas sp.]